MIDIGKLKTTLVDLILSNVIKKAEHDELVKKVNNVKTTDASDLVTKSWL